LVRTVNSNCFPKHNRLVFVAEMCVFCELGEELLNIFYFFVGKSCQNAPVSVAMPVCPQVTTPEELDEFL
jgi:hypothetical protein